MLRGVTSSMLWGITLSSAFAWAEAMRQDPVNVLDGCSQARSTGFQDGFSVTIDGFPRQFAVYVPATYNNTPIAKRPLIFDFHGAGGTSAKQYDNSMYWAHTEGQEYLVVYPQGVDNDWYGPPYADSRSVSDMYFVELLLAYMKENYCVDEANIFASGKSAGGGFVNTLACNETGDNFKAFAMAAPALYTDNPKACATPTNVRCVREKRKILEAHGIDDHIIKYDPECCLCDRKHGDDVYHNVSLPLISDWVWSWAARDGHTTVQPVPTSEPYGYVEYSESGNPGVVSHYRIHKLGHCWPQSHRTAANSDYQNPKLGCLSYALDFTDEVIKFFEAAATAPGDDGDNDGDNIRHEL